MQFESQEPAYARTNGQKLDDYLLEILSEAGKKDEIFSDRSLMKAQEKLTNIIRINWAMCDTCRTMPQQGIIF